MPTHGECPLTQPIVPGEEPLLAFDNPGGNLREGQLAALIRVGVDPREFASDADIETLPRADFTELVR